MLGLISDINDMLQDVQGKKSVTVKRKILRSLGALVSEIGPAVHNVAPQVHSPGTRLHAVYLTRIRSWQRFRPWSAYPSYPK